LLAEYGIKHGPIVASTRRLYEKKLNEVMAKGSSQHSPDKTYYREEEEEITYVTYHNPVKHEAYGDRLRRRGSFEQVQDEESDQDTESPIQSTRASSSSTVQARKPIKKSGGGCKSTVMKLLLFALVAGFLYYVYCTMENNGQNPFTEIGD